MKEQLLDGLECERVRIGEPLNNSYVPYQGKIRVEKLTFNKTGCVAQPILQCAPRRHFRLSVLYWPEYKKTQVIHHKIADEGLEKALEQLGIKWENKKYMLGLSRRMCLAFVTGVRPEAPDDKWIIRYNRYFRGLVKFKKPKWRHTVEVLVFIKPPDCREEYGLLLSYEPETETLMVLENSAKSWQALGLTGTHRFVVQQEIKKACKAYYYGPGYKQPRLI